MIWPAPTGTPSETICAHISAARPYVKRVCILIDVPLAHGEMILFGAVMERLARDGIRDLSVTLVQSPIQDMDSCLLAFQRLFDAVTRQRLCLASPLFHHTGDRTAMVFSLVQQLRNVPHEALWSREMQARERFTTLSGIGPVVRALARTLAIATASVYKE